MKVAGFDWDAGNLQKCRKHGVSIEQIEEVLGGPLRVYPDLNHSSLLERRWLGIGRTATDRYVFIAFTLRRRRGKLLLRPISARFMHRKEIEHYEKETAEDEIR